MAGEGLRKTPLAAAHRRLGARLVAFAGWEMPLQYRGILEEHRRVREAAGLFDLSHMGELHVLGPDAQAFLEWVLPARIGDLHPGRIRYTPLCRPDGGILDDILVYRLPPNGPWAGGYGLVVNAANTVRDRQWLLDLAAGRGAGPCPAPRVEIRDRSADLALLAVQGPGAEALVNSLAEDDLGSLGYYRAAPARLGGILVLASRTGYTGEDGFELYLPAATGPALWERILAAGAPVGLVPVGLGARDTLRLEAGLLLYGNDIDEDTNPLEAGLERTLALDKGDFVGREALAEVARRGPRRRLVGLVLAERGVPRHGHPVFAGDRRVGTVTSGALSPTLGEPIALAYVGAQEAARGSDLAVEIRGRRLAARQVPLPFVPHRTRGRRRAVE